MSDINVDITITLPDGRQATAAAAFRFTAPVPLPAPVIHHLSPAEGPVEGGTSVTITGQHFEPGATVTFGDRPALDVEVNEDGTTITCTTPALA